MTGSQHRVVVVGGGVVGAAAAWRLAGRGVRVTLLERFAPGHDRGASHGSSRIFRHAYPNVRYVALAARARRGWRDLEAATGAALLTETGAVDHGDPEAVDALADALADQQIAHRLVDPAAAAARWPGLRFDTAVLEHPAAGRVHADRAVAALHAAAAADGAEIRHGAQVLAVEPGPSGPTVVLDDELLSADQVVVASGAWTADLVGDALDLPPLVTTQEQPAHFPVRDGGAAWPSFLHHPGAGWDGPPIYGLDSEDGVKVGEHGTGPEVDPDHRPPIDPDRSARLAEYVREWVPGAHAGRGAPVSCLYTTTPDHDFVIDRREQITVAAGFSGHGFKFGPVLGDLVGDLVLDGAAPEPLFALDRFRTTSAGVR